MCVSVANREREPTLSFLHIRPLTYHTPSISSSDLLFAHFCHIFLNVFCLHPHLLCSKRRPCIHTSACTHAYTHTRNQTFLSPLDEYKFIAAAKCHTTCTHAKAYYLYTPLHTNTRTMPTCNLIGKNQLTRRPKAFREARSLLHSTKLSTFWGKTTPLPPGT